ncbi:beta-lactamase family protein [Stenotrophomonas maltophilia]|nr:beta-lactamase family protein [Stenotrophomonas maltophilia]
MSTNVNTGGAMMPAVRAVVDEVIERGRIVGAVVLVARHGQLIHRQAAGWLDREAALPMQVDAVFRYASLTKPIVSAAALALVEQGLIGLDDSLQHWLPEYTFRMAQGESGTITLRHLLTHTAGFDYGFLQAADGTYARAGVSDGLAEPGLQIDEQLRRLQSVPLGFVPGAAWHYSVALDVLGEVLARASGMSLPAMVERHVTQPLRMHDTGFRVADGSRLAVPYADGARPQRMQERQTVDFIEGTGGIHYAPSRILGASSFASGGAGMAGTAADFMRFLLAVADDGGAILAPHSAHAMMANQIGELRINMESTPSWGFGFGGAVLMDRDLAAVPHANGTWQWGGVYGNHWFVDPANALAVVVLTNTAIAGMTGEFPRALRDAIYQ